MKTVDLLLLAQSTQGFLKRGRHLERDLSALERLATVAGVIGWQFQHRWSPGNTTSPIAQQLFQQFSLKMSALPEGIIGILEREVWQRSRYSCAGGAIQGRQFAHEDLH